MGSPAGPSNPTPPGGPGRWLSAFLRSQEKESAARAIAAELAGGRSRAARPLTVQARQANYRRQNGVDVEGRLTPRQRRRVEHKRRHLAVTAGVSSPQWPKPEQPKPTAPKPAVAA